MTLREFFRILRRRWLTLLACLVVVVGAAAAVTLTRPKVYTAQTSVYLQTTLPPAATAGTVSKATSGGTTVVTAQDLNTFVAVLGSPSVVDPLRKRLGLAPDYPIDISASIAQTASILTITARDSDPATAARVANAVGPQLADVAGTFSPLLATSGQKVTSTTVSPAAAPSVPTSPDVTRDLELAVLAGLLLGIGLALARHALDTKVRGESDLQAESDSPLLAALPQEKGGAITTIVDDWGTSDEDSHHSYVEAIRRLRTSLMFVDVTTHGHSFVITSAVPGEGKTTTAINLARAVAETGARTLLLDGDLRRPTVASTLGLEGGVGLTTVLLGKADLTDVTQQWGETSLYVLPSGQVPPNPSELLGSERMAELFAKLTGDYDFVLIDSPPVLPVVDAVILDRLTAGLLMVVAADRTRKRDLAQAVKLLDTSEVDVSGFALNQVNLKSAMGYYGQHTYRSVRRGTRRAKGLKAPRSGRRRQQPTAR